MPRCAETEWGRVGGCPALLRERLGSWSPAPRKHTTPFGSHVHCPHLWTGVLGPACCMGGKGSQPLSCLATVRPRPPVSPQPPGASAGSSELVLQWAQAARWGVPGALRCGCWGRRASPTGTCSLGGEMMEVVWEGEAEHTAGAECVNLLLNLAMKMSYFPKLNGDGSFSHQTGWESQGQRELLAPRCCQKLNL